MKRLSIPALSLLVVLSGTFSARAVTPVKNIVLVHGAFADGSSWSKVIPLLQAKGYNVIAVQNPLEEASAAAQSVFPDILQYNWTKPALYPNGRGLTEDVFDARLAFLTHGKISSDGMGPHHDLLTEFPFLGVPNPQPAMAPAHS